MKGFDTNALFAGGAGMFLQYYDVVKPIYLYAILSIMLSNTDPGLPVDILYSMSPVSLVEWYIKRRYINPIKSLDWASVYTDD